MGEVLGAWGHANDDGAPDPASFLTDAAQEVDVLDPAGTLLRSPGMLASLENLATRGGTIRLLTDDQVLWLENEPRWDHIACRTPSADPPDLVILRADDAMLLALPLRDDQPLPLLALQRASGGIFDRLTERFNVLWEDAAQPVRSAAAVAAPEPEPARETVVDGSQPRRWPRRPTV